MRKRTREYVLLAITALAGAIYSWLTLGWSDVAFFGGMAGLIAVVVVVGMSWVELAPDGAFRHRPQS